MRWPEKQRLDFIENRLRGGHAIQRRDIIEKFGVSVPQASLDIKKFRALHPGALVYDASKKIYVRGIMVGCSKHPPRDTTAAAKSLIVADDEWLRTIALRDPSMIRDVAAALIYEREK